jgi:hypothetical protein
MLASGELQSPIRFFSERESSFGMKYANQIDVQFLA